MELNIAFLAKVNGDHSVSKRFFDASRARKKAMELIFWNEEMGQWNDYWFDTSAVKVLLDFIYLFILQIFKITCIYFEFFLLH